MDRQQIGLMLCLNRLGIPINLASFDDRLILQKSVCILQFSGVDLGYFFNWHVRGPYSPSLANDLFEIAPSIEDRQQQISTWSLDEKSDQRLGEINSLFDVETKSEKARFLEVSASILYVSKNDNLGVEDLPTLTHRLKEKGKNFTHFEVEKAVDCLSKAKFFE